MAARPLPLPDNRLGVQELDGTLVTFGYDPTYQLINEQRSGANAYNTTYQYDPLGNRLLKINSGSLTSYSYNSANALILMVPPTGQPTTSSFDRSGNLTLENAGGALTTYAWNDENRLSSVASATGVESYTYSDDGLRKQKVNASGTTNFVWDDQNLLIEADVNQVTQAHYTNYPGYWGGLASQRRSGASNFYGFDSQGSSRILVSIGGLVTDSYSYKAFGEELALGSSTINAMRYIGQYQYYGNTPNRLQVRARELDTAYGRWNSRDPLGFTSGTNLFGYANNNPVNSIDPSGAITITVGCNPGDCVFRFSNIERPDYSGLSTPCASLTFQVQISINGSVTITGSTGMVPGGSIGGTIGGGFQGQFQINCTCVDEVFPKSSFDLEMAKCHAKEVYTCGGIFRVIIGETGPPIKISCKGELRVRRIDCNPLSKDIVPSWVYEAVLPLIHQPEYRVFKLDNCGTKKKPFPNDCRGKPIVGDD